MAAFILDAHPQIEQDLSSGEGEYLSALVSMMGCENNANAIATLRASFSKAVDHGYYPRYGTGEEEIRALMFKLASETSAQVCTI
jgi:hypothetical protein